MKILDAKTLEELNLPIELYCTGASSTISNSFISINGHYGNYPIKNSASISMHNFNIQGTIEGKDKNGVENVKYVERIRSKIIADLYNKRLLFFRDDDDDRCRKCVLNGSVNITYNAGRVINRIFTISFILSCYDAVAWSKEIYTKELKIGVENDIEYSGQVSITPLIKIEAKNTDIQIRDSRDTPFIQCIYPDKSIRALFFEKETGSLNGFRIENGIVYTQKGVIKDIRHSSLLNPIILKTGHNKIRVNDHFIPINTEVKITLIYRECFY